MKHKILKKLNSYLIVVLLFLLVIPNSTTSQPSDPVTHEITVRNFSFIPEVLNIEIGDSVVFIWEDSAMGHNVEQVSDSSDTTYDSGGFRSGDPESGPAQWDLPDTFTQDNVTLFYICNPHVLSHSMRGKIIVGEGSIGDDESGGNLGLLLAIFAGSAIVTVGSIIILNKKGKSS